MFNILRVKKIKENGRITNVARHNFRLRISKNVDKKRTPLNLTMINKLGVDPKISSDLQVQLNKHYDSLGIKQKAENVKMLEFVVSASPEFFGDWHKNGKIRPQVYEKIRKWVTANKEFFKREFGENLILCELHLDEKTPHLHFCVALAHKSVKKYRNQYGEFFKETWSLSAKAYGPQYLSELHDRHAEANKEFKLMRGVRGNFKENRTTQEFNRMVTKANHEDLETEAKKSLEYIEQHKQNKLFGEPVIAVAEAKKAIEVGLGKAVKNLAALKAQNRFNFEKYVKDIKRKMELAEKREAEAEKARLEYREGLHQFENLSKFNARLEYEKKLLEAKIADLSVEVDEQKAILEKYGLIAVEEKNEKGETTRIKLQSKFPKPSPWNKK